MPRKTKQKVEFGDFQTPDALARRACTMLQELGVLPGSIVEPTCGRGSFLQAATETFVQCNQILGFEINPDYVQEAQGIERAAVHCADFFEQDWPHTLDSLREPILVVGNPPWVTNSTLGTLGSANLPAKANFARLRGLDAITGKSNFDVSEWMLLHLLDGLSGRQAVLAMLCKMTVARKVLRQAWLRHLQVAESTMYLLDAAAHFGAAVDACLLVCRLEPGAASDACAVFPRLDTSAPRLNTIAIRNGHWVADLDAFNACRHVFGKSPRKWRSGVKHDCVSVMELRPKGDRNFENGLGETVNLELAHVYPMLKSSDLMKPHPVPSRCMLVTQRSLGEDTASIAYKAPKTWHYLQSHACRLNRRASSIYAHQPPYAVFGVGPYSFAPWKVATSGFAKRLVFHCLGPVADKPVVLDDTCYFLPCHTEQDARTILALLNSQAAQEFFKAVVFGDAKRPLTAQLLAALDLGRLARETGVSLPTWTDVPPMHLPLFRAVL